MVDGMTMDCPECEQEMDWLDNIINKVTGRLEYRLYICHNEDCVGENLIYNDRCSYPEGGDPSGCY